MGFPGSRQGQRGVPRLGTVLGTDAGARPPQYPQCQHGALLRLWDGHQRRVGPGWTLVPGRAVVLWGFAEDQVVLLIVSPLDFNLVPAACSPSPAGTRWDTRLVPAWLRHPSGTPLGVWWPWGYKSLPFGGVGLDALGRNTRPLRLQHPPGQAVLPPRAGGTCPPPICRGASAPPGLVRPSVRAFSPDIPPRAGKK